MSDDATRGATEPAAAESDALAACPHLRSVDGPWHAATPSRAHRCALLGAGRPTLERQRLHCLGPTHVACPTWLEEHGDRGIDRPGPFVATAPVVLEGPGVALSAQGSVRRIVGPVTVVVGVVALGAFVLARGPFAPGSSGGIDPSPSATPAALATPSVATPAPATPAASPTPPSPTPAPTPTPRRATYTVKRGDTLSSIAERFGTTARKLARLNGIDDPSLIRVGQVLDLP
jgi:LysM repeat protein